MKRCCATCVHAPEREDGKNGCALCEGRIDRPHWDPDMDLVKVEEKIDRVSV